MKSQTPDDACTLPVLTLLLLRIALRKLFSDCKACRRLLFIGTLGSFWEKLSHVLWQVRGFFRKQDLAYMVFTVYVLVVQQCVYILLID